MNASETALNSQPLRVRVDGKFFRAGPEKFYIKGITYGPFAPSEPYGHFASPEQTAQDFRQITELGANVLRVYYVPPTWFLDLATEHGLKVLIDIPWAKHLCFLDSETSKAEARSTVRKAVEANKGHPAIFAYSVVNEISADIVRWSGVRQVTEFIELLIEDARKIDPDCLYTFTSFPPSEFLQPANTDFSCFNVYLHDRKSYEAYLARLQTLADAKPIMLGEFGIDSIREGEAHKSEILSWQIEGAFRAGLAGMVVFSYTDDWFRGGMQIEDWAFGLTTRERQAKTSFYVVQKQFRQAPHFPLSRTPKVSVVVASYNGGRTLPACLESLTRLNYPNYEVILVDDGSRDDTRQIAAKYPSVRYIHQENMGLSVARNTGIKASEGEIVAFTDSDCRADEDWLYYLVHDLRAGEFTAIGGHNFLPPEDSCVAAAVVVSPGGPAHVMLTDREAEHIPGCNMAFYKWALDEIKGFDSIFRKAGDDVDVCWRIQERGYRIGFSHSGFVWHYRRSTVKAYLKQQAGYGEAEAMLIRKHPEYFNSFGGGIWKGRIYTAAQHGILLQEPIIYHGVFASGFFQRLYTPQAALPLMLGSSLMFHALVNVPLALLSVYIPFLWPAAALSVLFSVGLCLAAGLQARLPRGQTRYWSRGLVAMLFFLQPIVRGWARLRTRLFYPVRTIANPGDADCKCLPVEPDSEFKFAYWSKGGAERLTFLHIIVSMLEREALSSKLDAGWSDYDVEMASNGWSRLYLTTVCEDLEQGKRVFRCRLKTAWSSQARLLFGVCCGAAALILPRFAEVLPWVWLLLVLLPLLYWFLEDARLSSISLAERIMDRAAASYNLIRLDSEAGRSRR